MNDTSLEMRELQNRLLMERSGEERFLMAVSMCQTARAIVRSSLSRDLPKVERRVQLFLRYYADDFDPAVREDIVAWIRSGSGSDQHGGV